MPKPLRSTLNRLISRLPLRAVLIIPFLLLILLVAMLIGILSFQNGERAVRDLATQLESEVGQRVEQTLITYLRMPQLANQVNADAVRQGLLDLNDLEAMQEYLWRQFNQFNNRSESQTVGSNLPHQPDDISRLALASEQGNYVGNGYYPSRDILTRSILDRRQDTTLRSWEVNQFGRQGELIAKSPDYDPRRRDWYKKAVQAGHLIWSDPYSTVEPHEDYVISANQPLYDRKGNLMGVADATLSLRDMNEFLHSLKVGTSGQIFIMKLDGNLVATSTQENPFVITENGLGSIRAVESEDPLTQATAEYLLQKFGSFDRVNFLLQQAPQQLEFLAPNREKHFVRVEAFRDRRYAGLDWLVVITVPQKDFMSQIWANNLTTGLLCLLGSVGAIVLGIAAGRWLTRPIMQLSRAADGLAKGDWDRPVTIKRSGELGVLVNAFNHMRQELKYSHQQLEEYSRGLEQKNEELETLEAELRRQLNLFLRAVSHDLRNPVLGMSMVLNNLSSQSGDEIRLSRKVLERMQESSRHQLELINSLIDTHAAEMWGITFHPQPVTLRRLVVNSVSDLQPMLDKEQAQLDNRISEQLPLVQVDPLQLGRVYQNLLANALKHNPTGLTITLDARPEGQRIYCTVSDNGVGIPPEQRDRLFDPYFRGSNKPKSVGLGLGLYLCQQIIQAHEGEIGVDSQPGAGTTFWFTLPIVSSTVQTNGAGVTEPSQVTEPCEVPDAHR